MVTQVIKFEGRKGHFTFSTLNLVAFQIPLAKVTDMTLTRTGTGSVSHTASCHSKEKVKPF